MGPASKTTPIMLMKSQSSAFHFGEIFPLCKSSDSGVIQHGLLTVCTHFCTPSNVWCIETHARPRAQSLLEKKCLPVEQGARTFFAFRANNHCRRPYLYALLDVCRCVTGVHCFIAHVCPAHNPSQTCRIDCTYCVVASVPITFICRHRWGSQQPWQLHCKKTSPFLLFLTFITKFLCWEERNWCPIGNYLRHDNTVFAEGP